MRFSCPLHSSTVKPYISSPVMTYIIKIKRKPVRYSSWNYAATIFFLIWPYKKNGEEKTFPPCWNIGSTLRWMQLTSLRKELKVTTTGFIFRFLLIGKFSPSLGTIAVTSSRQQWVHLGSNGSSYICMYLRIFLYLECQIWTSRFFPKRLLLSQFFDSSDR